MATNMDSAQLEAGLADVGTALTAVEEAKKQMEDAATRASDAGFGGVGSAAAAVNTVVSENNATMAKVIERINAAADALRATIKTATEQEAEMAKKINAYSSTAGSN